MLRAAIVATSSLAVLLSASPAAAFSTYSVVARGCHEEITLDALGRARAVRPEARSITPQTRDDRAFVDDLNLKPDERLEDLAAATLVTGVRFNDLKGNAPNAVDALALVHGDPSGQSEHCLRAPHQDEPGGTEAALRDCRGFIREKVREALGGLDASGAPDPSKRTSLAVDLALRGRVDASLPLFWAALGQALHALQDGFSHTYRSEDRTKVRVVLNFSEVVQKEHVAERDGPEHSMALDQCEGEAPLQKRNVELATQASFEILVAALDGAKAPDAKIAEVDAVLDRYFTYEGGCTAANGWCNAPEPDVKEASACGCAVPGLGGGRGWGLGALVATLLVAGAARRRRSRALAAHVVMAILLSSASARADEEPAPTAAPPPPPEATVPTVVKPEEAKAEVVERQHQTPFALYVAGAGSISNPGLAGMAGVRFRLSDVWVVGADGEYNAWYGIQSGRLRSGAVSFYASLTARFPLRFAPVNLRSTVQAGASVQLIDLYGVPSGTTGIFAGLNPLGVEVKLSRHVYMIAYPLGVAVPAPQLSGAPFSYPQYRATLGLEISP